MFQVGAAWIKENKDGKFLSGNFGGKDCRIMIFPNKYKKSDNHPDYVIYVAGKNFGNDNNNGHGGGSEDNGLSQSDYEQAEMI